MIDFAHKDRELQRQQKQDDGYARGVIWALEWVQKE